MVLVARNYKFFGRASGLKWGQNVEKGEKEKREKRGKKE